MFSSVRTKVFALFFAALLKASNASVMEKNGETIRQDKSRELAILILLPVTGDLPRNGQACKIAIEIMLDEVNKRTDILPDYRLTAIYKDEGEQAALSNAAAIGLKRQWENDAKISSTINGDPVNKTLQFLSPLIIGPYYSDGCLALARHVHLNDMVQLAISCTSPQGTENRRLYPNLYRTKSSGELAAFPQLHFIREVGRWNRFGILTNAGFVFDYTLATFLLQVAIEEGFNVSYFDCVTEIDDNTMAALQNSGTRVVVVDTSQPAFVLQFLCQTYKFGMTGSMFAFIIHRAAFFESSGLSYEFGIKGCTRDIVYEQMKYAFWSGWSMTPSPTTLQSINADTPPLNLSVERFESKFNNNTGFVKPKDYDKRFNCADAVYQAILTLDSSEKMLQLENLSLADYSLYPKKIMTTVNKSIAESRFVSYRIGKFSYSPRLELDNDIQDVAQWLRETGELHLFDIVLLNATALYNYSSYRIRKTEQQPVWFSQDGKPPKDQATVFYILEATPFSSCVTLILAGLLLTGGEITGFVKSLVKPVREQYPGINQRSRIVLFIGCLILNLCALSCSISAHFRVLLFDLCELNRILFVLGLGLTNGFVLSRTLAFQSSKIPSSRQRGEAAVRVRIQLRAIHRNSSFNTLNNVPRMKFLYYGSKFEHRTIHLMVLIFILHAVYATVWMLSDPSRIRVENYGSSTLKPTQTLHAAYDVKLTYSFVCASRGETAWLGSFGLTHIVLLCVAAFLWFDLKRDKPKFAKYHPDFNSIRLAIVNVATLLVGCALLLITSQNPIYHLIILSITAMGISGGTFFIIFKRIIIR